MTKLGFTLDGLAVYINPNTVKGKIGVRGKMMPLPDMLGIMPKSERRKFRKGLRRCGFAGLAGIPTNPNN